MAKPLFQNLHEVAVKIKNKPAKLAMLINSKDSLSDRFAIVLQIQAILETIAMDEPNQQLKIDNL